MFDIKHSDENSALDNVIDSLLNDMQEKDTLLPEYTVMVDNLVKLNALKDAKSKKRVSPDTIAIIAANLLGIMIIIGHERANVITSKAMSFIPKLN